MATKQTAPTYEEIMDPRYDISQGSSGYNSAAKQQYYRAPNY